MLHEPCVVSLLCVYTAAGVLLWLQFDYAFLLFILAGGWRVWATVSTLSQLDPSSKHTDTHAQSLIRTHTNMRASRSFQLPLSWQLAVVIQWNVKAFRPIKTHAHTHRWGDALMVFRHEGQNFKGNTSGQQSCWNGVQYGRGYYLGHLLTCFCLTGVCDFFKQSINWHLLCERCNKSSCWSFLIPSESVPLFDAFQPVYINERLLVNSSNVLCEGWAWYHKVLLTSKSLL